MFVLATMIPSDVVASAAMQLAQKADLPTYEGAFAQAALERWVAQHIGQLLAAGRHEWLLQVCYRVDVAEAAVRDAFALREPAEISAELARLLVAREVQKALSRARYKGHQ